MPSPNPSAKVEVMFNFGEGAFQFRHDGTQRSISIDTNIVLTNLLRDLGGLPVGSYRAAVTVCFTLLGVFLFCAIPVGIFHNLPAFIVLASVGGLLLLGVGALAAQFAKFRLRVRETARKYALEKPVVTLIFGCGLCHFLRLAFSTRDHLFCTLNVGLAPTEPTLPPAPVLRVVATPATPELIPVSLATPDAHDTSISHSLELSWVPPRNRLPQRYATETQTDTDRRLASTRTDFGGNAVSSIIDMSKDFPTVPNPNLPFPPKQVARKPSALSYDSILQESPSHVRIAEH